jgi:imidazolonepropionase
MTLVVDDIGLLVTNDTAVGDGSLGIRRDVALVIDDDRVLAIEPRGAAADERIDAGGRCLLPGFVDSHTHLVFAGDRGDEFVARMAGAPYAAGGILTTVAATRAASSEELARALAGRRAEALRNGITSLEIKSGYGLTVEHERRLLEVAAVETPDTTLLAAHVVPPEYERRPDDYVALMCGDMLDAVAGACRWVDAFCERGAFDADQCRAVLTAAAERGLGTRLHANQLGHGPGVQLAVELGCASADHCTYLSDADVEALAGGSTVATLLPATDFSTRQPYPDARRLLDAGATVAIATNCNPGSSYTSSMAFCVALAVRDMRMTIEEALQAATTGGAAALRRPELGRLAPGSPADAVVLDAPSYTHLVYRPGMQLVAGTLLAGRPSPGLSSLTALR